MTAAESLMLVADASLRAAAVLGAGWIVSLALRRASAATRHFTWLCAIVAAALIPVAAFVTPDWHVPSPVPEWRLSPAGESTSTHMAIVAPIAIGEAPATGDRELGVRRAATSSSASPAEPVNYAALALVVWVAGAAIVALYGVIGALVAARVRRSARPVAATWGDDARAFAEAFELPPATSFVESAMTRMPIVCGIWRPAIVMPSDAAAWPPERVRAAVLHELAHVKRRDCLTQGIARIVCAIYWFNPLAWLAARRLRVERERACDDFVLAAGTKASEYAGHLLEIARTPGPRFPMLAGAGVPMAHRSQLEGRLMAILDPNTRRSSRRSTRLAALLVTAAVAVPAAAVHVQNPVQARNLPPAGRNVTLLASSESPRLDPAGGDGVARPEAVTVPPALDEPPMGPSLDIPAERADDAPVETSRDTAGLERPVAVASQRTTDVERRAGRALDRALIEAAEDGDVEGISELILAGADVNGAVDGDGSPLIAAARSGRLDIVRLLLDRGADPNLAVPGDGNPIIMAAREGHAAVVELLLQRGAYVDQVVDGDENALIQASAAGRLEMVKLLVAHGADVNTLVEARTVVQLAQEVYDSSGRRRVLPVRRVVEWRSPLGMARWRGHQDVVEFLLQRGAHVGQVMDGDENALVQAAGAGRLETVKLLVARGVDVNARAWVVEKVIQNRVVEDANGRRRLVSSPSSNGRLRSPLSMAREGDHAEVVAYLLSVGVQD